MARKSELQEVEVTLPSGFKTTMQMTEEEAAKQKSGAGKAKQEPVSTRARQPAAKADVEHK